MSYNKGLAAVCAAVLLGILSLGFSACASGASAKPEDIRAEKPWQAVQTDENGVKSVLISDFEPEEKMWVVFSNIDEYNTPAGAGPKKPTDIVWANYHPGYNDVYQVPAEGTSFDTATFKTGKASMKWFSTLVATRICAAGMPHDWSGYNYLSMYMYSEVANFAAIEVVAYSEDLTTESDDYFKREIVVDWQGWKLVEIEFKEFAATRKPVGWKQIDYVKIASSGWGHTPMEDTVVYMDTLRLTDKSLASGEEEKISIQFTKAEHPKLFINKDDIADIKKKIKTQKWAEAGWINLKISATEIFNETIRIPNEGGFYHETGPSKYDSAITDEHYRLARGARDMALIYQIEGNKAYAEKVKAMMLEYAKKYPTLMLHDKYENEGPTATTGGKVTSQSMNEAKWLAYLAWAYDLTYDVYTAEERTSIENNIFREAAEIIKQNSEGRHNHQSWYNLGVGVAGILLQEPKYMRYAVISSSNGFLYQMRASVSRDGFWYEGSGHYHFNTLEPIVYLAEALVRNISDPNIMEREEMSNYANLFTFPVKMVDPSMRMPTINDGRVVDITLEERTRYLEIGYYRFRDPLLVPILKKAIRNSLEALVYGVADLPKAVKLTFPSELIDDSLVVLRSPDNTIFATLNGYPYGGSHSHYDRLSITFYGNGKLLSKDPGSILYRDERHEGYLKTTVAHDTVVVDRSKQDYAPAATVLGFSAGPMAQFVRFQDDKANKNVVLDRALLMSDWYMVDLFKVSAKEKHHYDFVYKNIGKFATDIPVTDTKLRFTNGYQYLEQTKTGKIEKDTRFTWDLYGGQFLDMYLYTDTPMDLTVANFMKAMDDSDEIHPIRDTGVLLGVDGNEALYSVVYIPTVAERPYTIKRMEVKQSGSVTSNMSGALSLFNKKTNTTDFIIYNRGAFVDMEVAGYKTDATSALIRVVNGKVTDIFISQASYIKTPNGEIIIGPGIAGIRQPATLIQVQITAKDLFIYNDSAKRDIMQVKGLFSGQPKLYMTEDGKEVQVDALEVSDGAIKFSAEQAMYRIPIK